MSSARLAGRGRTVQNLQVSLLARLTLVCAVALSGCAWDGPSSGVRVVPEATVPDGDLTAAGDRVETADGSDDDDVDTASGGGRLPGTAASGSDVEDGPDDDVVLPFPSTVAVVGDSLTLSAHDQITTELTDLGLDVLVVDGVESRRMTAGSSALPSGLDAIHSIREEFAVEPDLWVIALGTNDVGAQVDEQRFRDDLRRTTTAVGPGAAVVWVDIWIRDRRDAVITANGMIRDEIAELSSPSGVVGWFAYGTDNGVITGDGVHLTGRGRSAFAAAIADQVRAVYGR